MISNLIHLVSFGSCHMKLVHKLICFGFVYLLALISHSALLFSPTPCLTLLFSLTPFLTLRYSQAPFLALFRFSALLFCLTPLSALNICVKPLLPVSSLPIVRLQVQSAKSGYGEGHISKMYVNLFQVFLVLHLPWVIPARGVTDIVFREPILILPPVKTNPCIPIPDWIIG